MKSKAVMLVLAAVAIVSLVVVGFAVKPMARAQGGEEESEPIGTIGEITTELRAMNDNFGRLIQVMGEEEVIEWTGKVAAGGDLISASMQRMFSNMLDASGGGLELQTIPLGDGPQGALNELNQGEIDFVDMSFTYWTNIFPAAELFDMKAGGLSPMEQYMWFISGEGGELAQQMIDAAAYNVHLVPGGGQLWTPEIFLHSNTIIEVPADLVGLKIRSFGNSAEILSLMGAEVFLLPGGEIYEALQTGNITAAEFSSAFFNWDIGLNEVATYVYLSECRVPHQFYMFLVNKTSWEELPDDLKVIVEKITREEAITVYAEICQADIEAIEQFQDYGCTVEKLPVEVKKAFLEKANEYYAARALEDPFYDEVLQSQRDFRKTIRKTWRRL